MTSSTYFYISGLISDERAVLDVCDFSHHGEREEEVRKTRLEEAQKAQIELDALYNGSK